MLTPAKKLQLITKHCPKFASKPKSTDSVLKGVYYAADGSVVVTDRHRMLRIANAHSFAEPFVADAKTGAVIEGNYPDTSRIISSDGGSTQITLRGVQIKSLAERVKVAALLAKVTDSGTSIVTVEVSSEARPKIHANYPESGVVASLEVPSEWYGDCLRISCNAEYLLEAVNVFSDAGSPQVTIDFYGTMRPIVLRDETNGIEAVVLPYRTAS